MWPPAVAAAVMVVAAVVVDGEQYIYEHNKAFALR